MRLVLSTTPVKDASSLAKKLVEERLAACVNIVPKISSVYIWKGELQEDTEALLFIKTTASCVGPLTHRLKALHPYDVPEIITLKVSEKEGNLDYLSWVRNAVV